MLFIKRCLTAVALLLLVASVARAGSFVDQNGNTQTTTDVTIHGPNAGDQSRTVTPVGGVTASVTASPAVTASIYTAGNCMGTLQTLTSAARTNGPATLMIQSVVMTDKAGQNDAEDIVVFKANPTSSTFTDKSACAVNAADLGKIAGIIHMVDAATVGTPGVVQAQNVALPVVLTAGTTTLYAVAITRGTPTPTSVSDRTYTYTVFQD